MKLVLLPGLDGTGRLFEPFLGVLPSQLSSVIISYPTDQLLSYAELVQFARQHLPSDEDYVLLAESFSGPIAIELAAVREKNLKALVLIASFASSPAFLPQILSLLLFRTSLMLSPPKFVVSRYLLGADAPRDLIEIFRQATTSVRPDVMALRMRSVISVDVRRSFAACQLPILYLRATQDRLVRRRSLVELQKIRTEMALVDVDGPHLLLQREPAKCAEVIVHYLSETFDL